jgi:serine/threonine protein kinase
MVDRSRQISNGLVYIHSKKYVHRDVKMSNILVSTWSYYLVPLW